MQGMWPAASLSIRVITSYSIHYTKLYDERRIGHEIAVYHSTLTAGERYDEWKRMATGQAKVVIGARSAVFAPLKDIGVIIIDEEHESSYKSDMHPKYTAHEVVV